MKIKLPPVLETYIESSNASNFEKFIDCFSKSATVWDEGESLKGHSEIQKWFTKTRSKYQFRSEPLAIEINGDNCILKSKVTGTFPGSPITLSYQFQLQNNLIEDLRIL